MFLQFSQNRIFSMIRTVYLTSVKYVSQSDVLTHVFTKPARISDKWNDFFPALKLNITGEQTAFIIELRERNKQHFALILKCKWGLLFFSHCNQVSFRHKTIRLRKSTTHTHLPLHARPHIPATANQKPFP